MKIEVGSTSRLIQGSVFDVPKAKLEQVIKHYDEQLYIKWNPNKKRGLGTWELRRRPQYKEVVESYDLNGIGIHRLEYKEYDIENHVFDLPALTYSLLDHLKRADQWNKIDYQGKGHRLNAHLNEIDKNYYAAKDKKKQDMLDDMLYGIKQDKKILHGYREEIQRGVNPAAIMRYWK